MSISIQNLRVGYQGSDTLINIPDISINGGQLIGLVGVNGCGKSTLLRTLANFQQGLSGKVRVNGQNIADIPPSELSKLISIVLTDQITMGYGTVYDVVASGRFPYISSYGRLKKADHDIVMHALNLVGMSNFVSKPLDNLSDGQRQKIVLAKSLAQETPFILLDEPMAFLDLPSKMELSYLLHDISKTQGKGILLSTHDLDLAMHTCDKMWLVSNREITEGIPEDLALNGCFEAVFNTPAVAFNKQTGHFEFGRKTNKSVQVVCGDTLELFWLRKALSRVGVQVNEDSSEVISKIATGWRVVWSGQIHEVKTLEQVIQKFI